MNGRVYDPLTAMFFSPDPFVQAPDNWLNYNRYSYVLNNPLKYTDPSGNWYIFPSVSYSYYGGLSVGISAGFGIPGGASVGGSVSYNFRQKNWTFTGNASFSGLYAYAGYDTKAGVVAGVGAGFSSFTAGNFSFPMNLTGLSINYSGKGGMSLSMFGFNMGSDGVIFDPSITVGLTMKWGTLDFEDSETSSVTNLEDSSLKSQEEANSYTKDLGLNKKDHGIDNVEYGHVNETISDKYSWNENGILVNNNGEEKAGLTRAKFNGLNVTQRVYISPHNSNRNFVITLNHELIHVYHNSSIFYRALVGEKEYLNYTETAAYDYENKFRHNPMPKKFSTYTGKVLLSYPHKLLQIPSKDL
jgi:hypothetical protein